MGSYYPYDLALNARSGSFPSSMYGSRVPAAENEMREMEFRQAGEVPYAPRKSRRGRRSRLTKNERNSINARYENLPYGPGGYTLGFQGTNRTIGANPRAPVHPPGGRDSYNGDVVPFSLYGGSRRGKSRRRRTSKKRTRKQRRRG